MRWIVVVLVLGAAVGIWVLTGEESTDRAARNETARAVGPTSRAVEGAARSDYPPPIDLDKVDRNRDLHGVVVRAADGAPVPGGHISVRFHVRRALNLPGEYGQERPANGPTTISGADGSFSIPLAADAGCDLEVRADGYAPYVAAMCRAGGRLRIELSEPVSVSLEVLDAEGAPVEGASVWMVRHVHQDPPALDVHGKTDSSGRLVLRDLPAGLDVSLDVEHPRHGSRRWFRDFALPDSGTREEEVRFEAGRRIHGRVTDFETGAPIAGARVGTGRYWSPYVTETDEDGRYELGGWSFPGHVTMAVHADGYGSGGAAIGAKDEIDFRLSRGFVVHGIVVGPDARPIAGERVSATGRGYASRRGAPGSVSVLSMGSGTTAADGSFEIGGLRHGTRHALVIAAAGFGRVVYEMLPPARGASSQVDVGRIELPVARSIRGRLVRGAQAISNKRIELIGSNADRARMLGGERSRGVFDGTRVDARTDDQGRFSFRDLAKGTYVVRYREPGSQYLNKSVDLADADVEVLVEAPEGRPLPVLVVDHEDRPVAGVTLWVELRGGHTAIQTDKQGRAVVRLTSPPKSIHARPRDPGLVPVLLELRGDEQDLRIVLERGLAIRGVAVTDEGATIAQPVVEAQRDGKKVASTTGTAKGEFTLYVTAGGPCRVKFVGEASSGGHTSGRWVGSLTGVMPGGVPVRLVVSSPTSNRSLTVRVLLPDGTPVKGAMVAIFGPTDANGERKLTRLPNRRIPLWVQWKTTEYAPPRMTNVVPAGQTVELRFRTANPITGRLVRDGKPVSKSRVSIQRAREVLAYTETDAEGTFRLLVAAEEAGPFQLEVSQPGRPPLRLTNVAAGSKNLTVRWKDLAAR